MVLSKRLRAIAELVSPGLVVADIGTDHAQLPIWLTEQGRCPAAIAMDVKEGPLRRAEEGVRAAALEDRIGIRLSDGFSALRPGEARSAVIAGMGGDLMIRILRDGSGVAASLDEIICSPQSHIARVRAFAREQGYAVDAEDMVLEDGKFYQMFRLRPGKGKDAADRDEGMGARELEDRYGPVLLREGHPVLLRYLDWEQGVLEQILAGLARAGGSAEGRREEVLAGLEHNRAARAYIRKQDRGTGA